MQSNAVQILKKVESYSPDMQREILEFIENKYKFKTPTTKKKSPLRNEPFIGMWKNRPEMKDSAQYVRNLRKTQSLRTHS